MQVKYSHCDIEPFHSATIRKKGRPTLDDNPFRLPMKYSQTIPINKEKLKDIMALMSYIPAAFQKYFENLRGEKRDEETDT
jgi:hypothetical protein